MILSIYSCNNFSDTNSYRDSPDTDTDQIFDEYPDMDRISDGYKYKFGDILDMK
jgi:hypothetical protein